MAVEVDGELCTGCELCVDECPNDVLQVLEDLCEVASPDDCDDCGRCVEECPNDALSIP